MQEVLGDYESLVQSQNQKLDELGIERADLSMLDHICYRVETIGRYQEMQKLIGRLATLIDESEVSGRLISTFEFSDPLSAGGWHIPYLELPQPKDGSPYPEGLEHSEFVVIGSLKRFQNKYSHLPFNTGALNKPLNPELGLKVPGLSVKFHELQLGAVTRIEQSIQE